MGKQATELKANPLERRGDPTLCSICNPRTDRIGHDVVWRLSLELKRCPLKAGVKV